MKLKGFNIIIFFSLLTVLFSCKKIDEELVADFTVNYRKINAGEKLKFFDKSKNGPTSWNWIFNGGTPELSEEQNPEIIYLNPGFYSVSLTVSNAAGNNSLVKSEYIEVVEFSCGNDVIDKRDYKLYNTVTIGNYCWLKQNLNTGTFVSTPSILSDNDIIEKLCYNNDEQNCNIFGGIYTWEEMMNYNTSPFVAICPSGFFIPSVDIYADLINTLGGDVLAGGALKKQGDEYWEYPNTGATDTYGFSALASGYHQQSVFMNLRKNALFWTSTAFDSDNAFTKILFYDNTAITDSIMSKQIGASVRCVRNL